MKNKASNCRRLIYSVCRFNFSNMQNHYGTTLEKCLEKVHCGKGPQSLYALECTGVSNRNRVPDSRSLLRFQIYPKPNNIGRLPVVEKGNVNIGINSNNSIACAKWKHDKKLFVIIFVHLDA
jgi:hypothetical protein